MQLSTHAYSPPPQKKKWTVHITSCASRMMRCAVHFFRGYLRPPKIISQISINDNHEACSITCYEMGSIYNVPLIRLRITKE